MKKKTTKMNLKNVLLVRKIFSLLLFRKIRWKSSFFISSTSIAVSCEKFPLKIIRNKSFVSSSSR